MEIVTRMMEPSFLLALLVAVSVFATLMTLVIPFFERGDLEQRMKSVALERDAIRARERARMNAQEKRGSLRHENNRSIRQIVEKLNLKSALADEKTVAKLRMAGYRSQNALNVFLFARFVLPFLFLAVALFYLLGLGGLLEGFHPEARQRTGLGGQQQPADR